MVHSESPPISPVSSLMPSDVWKGLGTGTVCSHAEWAQAGVPKLTLNYLGNAEVCPPLTAEKSDLPPSKHGLLESDSGPLSVWMCLVAEAPQHALTTRSHPWLAFWFPPKPPWKTYVRWGIHARLPPLLQLWGNCCWHYHLMTYLQTITIIFKC